MSSKPSFSLVKNKKRLSHVIVGGLKKKLKQYIRLHSDSNAMKGVQSILNDMDSHPNNVCLPVVEEPNISMSL